MIIDAHLHLDEKVDGTAEGAAAELDKQLQQAGIARAVVLHLETQPWSESTVASALAPYPRLKGFVNIHPSTSNAVEQLHKAVNELGFIGLKLHPRLQEFAIDDIATIALVKAAGDLDIPVLIDAFPDGTHLMQGFHPVRFATLAKECSQTKIIWAHMGGHYVLDFMMLAKRLPNIYMDISYSFLYYRNSHVTNDMIYAMQSMRFERIFYGSDYPDRSIAETLEQSLDIFREKGIEGTMLNKILSQNAIDFFRWKDL